jgi:hypothetical protein
MPHAGLLGVLDRWIVKVGYLPLLAGAPRRLLGDDARNTVAWRHLHVIRRQCPADTGLDRVAGEELMRTLVTVA